MMYIDYEERIREYLESHEGTMCVFSTTEGVTVDNELYQTALDEGYELPEVDDWIINIAADPYDLTCTVVLTENLAGDLYLRYDFVGWRDAFDRLSENKEVCSQGYRIDDSGGRGSLYQEYLDEYCEMDMWE